MSASEGHSHPAPEHAEEHHGHSPWFYVAIAVFLAILTATELGPLFKLYQLPAEALVGLSAVKFCTVVAFFMHLWDDDKVLTRVFGAPLIGAILMVSVLMTLFHTWHPSPIKDNFAVAERYGEVWNGPCSSWLRSQESNRLYCSSPPIERDRIAMYLGAPNGASSGPPAIDLAGKSDDEKKAILVKRGETLFKQNCVACHQETGLGVPGTYPPLAGSDFIGDANHHAGIILHGLSGQITVVGKPFNGVMSSFGQLSDFNIASIATYERNSWGNALGMVQPEDVKAAR